MELLITFLAGMSVLVGAAVVRYSKRPDLLAHVSLSLALGAMAMLALFDLGPETLELAGEVGVVPTLLTVGLGVGLLASLEFFIPDHDAAERSGGEAGEEASEVHVGLMTVAALVLHNLVEGMAIYALSLESLQGGMVYALGVALHNVPMGMLICTTLRDEGRSVKASALTGALVSTALGGVAMMLLSSMLTEVVMGMLTALALGMILYIMFAELLPHVLRERPVWVGAAGTLAGFVLVWAATLLG